MEPRFPRCLAPHARSCATRSTVTQREEEPGGIDRRLSAALQTTVSPLDLEEWSQSIGKQQSWRVVRFEFFVSGPGVHGDAVRLDNK